MKDAKGHGSNERGGRLAKPIPGHPYHKKTDAELRYIQKDANEAAHAMRGQTSYDPNSGKRQDIEGKYLDQVNDASTVLGYRDRGGKSDHPDAVAARALASGPKSAPTPMHDAMGGSGPRWSYQDARGVQQTGKMEKYITGQGSDHTAAMRSDSGELHMVSGSRFKGMKRI